MGKELANQTLSVNELPALSAQEDQFVEGIAAGLSPIEVMQRITPATNYESNRLKAHRWMKKESIHFLPWRWRAERIRHLALLPTWTGMGEL